MKHLSEFDIQSANTEPAQTDPANNSTSAPIQSGEPDHDASTEAAAIKPIPDPIRTITADNLEVLPSADMEVMTDGALSNPYKQIGERSDEKAPVVELSPPAAPRAPISGVWEYFATVQKANFQHKSLANFSLNTVIGCFHGCLFCYVPSVSTNKQAPKLNELGVIDTDADWGTYGFVRGWDEQKFRKSVAAAEAMLSRGLPADGHGAVMLSTTSDPYQRFKNVNPAEGKRLTELNEVIVRKSLKIILDESNLKVRFLTRSPKAKKDFDLMLKFGDRLLFGMSIPTLNDKLARVYEPNAPAISQRLKTLRAAKEKGIPIFVAMAPTYPECDEDDIRRTLEEFKKLGVVTIFHEPINIRAENVARIQAHALKEGVPLKTEVFASKASWKQYVLDQLRLVERVAREVDVFDRLHLWPDPELGTREFIKAQDNPVEYVAWLESWWNRISEWPGVNGGKPGKMTPVAPSGKNKAEPVSPLKVATAAGPAGLTIRSPKEILAMEFNSKDLYLKNGIFSKGQSFSMLGGGGLGKSRILLQLAVCTILGWPFVGMEVQAKDLTWLDLQGENSNSRLKADLKALKKWVGEENWKKVEGKLHFHTLEKPEDSSLSLGDDAVVAELKDLIEKFQPDVIAVDPLIAFAAGSLNNDAGMDATCKALNQIARAGGKVASIVVLHHTLTGKAGAAKATGYDRGSYGRGSKVLNFWTRGQLNIAAVSLNSNEKLVMSCGKNSNGKEFDPIGIWLNPKTMIYEVDPEFDLGEWQAEAAGQADKPKNLTPADLRDIVSQAPLSRKDLTKAITDHSDRKKSTAYALIARAIGKTIKLNAENRFEAI
ncbi:MAG: hypothetical protein JWL90_4744 [Chthoniobacteraceae bacterium]|nr:hypothetical protein [Chthoniobacteraceae bacterium]